MNGLIAVIDLGKTHSKVALVDGQRATEIDVVRQRTTPNPKALYRSLNHQRIEAFLISALTRFAQQYTIDALTVTTHGATIALLDKHGNLALPVLDYECTDIDSLRNEYEQVRPAFSQTGSPALPAGLNIGAQLYWQQTRFPKEFDAVAYILTWPQYWVHWLTGKYANDITSLGCHTDCYSVKATGYSGLLQSQRWSDRFPPLKHSGEFAGGLLATVSQQTGLAEGLPVHVGIHDSNASLVPHLVHQKKPFSVVSTGTWFVCMAVGAKSIELDESRDTLMNVSAFGEPVPSARFMGGRERELTGLPVSLDQSSVETFLNHIESAALMMPSVVEGTGPFPECDTAWIDLHEHHSEVHQACACSLYLALMAHECLQLIGADGSTFVEGPLTQDTLFLDMLTVASERPVRVSESETGTCVGAAMLISKPIEKPVYRLHSVSSRVRHCLSLYRRRWLEALSRHTK